MSGWDTKTSSESHMHIVSFPLPALRLSRQSQKLQLIGLDKRNAGTCLLVSHSLVYVSRLCLISSQDAQNPPMLWFQIYQLREETP
jgi:hypothetical protein